MFKTIEETQNGKKQKHIFKDIGPNFKGVTIWWPVFTTAISGCDRS